MPSFLSPGASKELQRSAGRFLEIETVATTAQLLLLEKPKSNQVPVLRFLLSVPSTSSQLSNNALNVSSLSLISYPITSSRFSRLVCTLLQRPALRHLLCSFAIASFLRPQRLSPTELSSTRLHQTNIFQQLHAYCFIVQRLPCISHLCKSLQFFFLLAATVFVYFSLQSCSLITALFSTFYWLIAPAINPFSAILEITLEVASISAQDFVSTASRFFVTYFTPSELALCLFEVSF